MGIETSKTRQPFTGARQSSRRIRLPGLRLATSERRLLLLVMELLLINLALAASVVIGWDPLVTLAMLTAPFKWYLTLIAVWVVVALFFDLYDLARAASTFAIVRSASAAAVSTALIYSLIPNLTATLQSRTQIFVFFGLAWLAIVAWRMAYSLLFIQPFFRQRAGGGRGLGRPHPGRGHAGGAPRRQPLPRHRL